MRNKTDTSSSHSVTFDASKRRSNSDMQRIVSTIRLLLTDEREHSTALISRSTLYMRLTQSDSCRTSVS